MVFHLILAVGSVAAGAIAAVAGFGIGSLLTPLLALHVGAKLAVAAISIPHVLGTALRFYHLRAHVNRRVLWSFGLTSAAGGLLGALAHTYASSPVLAVVFGLLLIFAGGSELTGLAQQMRFSGALAWSGAVSGALGGLVGNQGGIRSAALLGFALSKEAFVATATAIALFVDVACLPVYFVTQARQIAEIWFLVAVGAAGVLIGTVFGERLLARLPERLFRRAVAILILILGLVILFRQESA